jgi:hypothetical protein
MAFSTALNPGDYPAFIGQQRHQPLDPPARRDDVVVEEDQNVPRRAGSTGIPCGRHSSMRLANNLNIVETRSRDVLKIADGTSIIDEDDIRAIAMMPPQGLDAADREKRLPILSHHDGGTHFKPLP